MGNEVKRVVVCDLGGVIWPLIDMDQWWSKLYLKSTWRNTAKFKRAKEIALEIAWEPFERGGRSADIFQILFRGILNIESMGIEEFWHHYTHIVGEINKPLIACLQEMRGRGIVLALLSNLDAMRHQHISDNLCDAYQMVVAPFHYLFFSYKTGSRKPESEIYRRVFRKVSVLPQYAYYIDDWPHAIEGMAATIPDMPRENMHLYHVDRHEDAEAFFRRHGLIA